jgi:hypothetical protein
MASVAEVHKILTHCIPAEVDIGILVAFVGSKVSKFLMCEMHHLIPNIEAIAGSCREYVDSINISFPFVLENSTMDQLSAFICTVVGLLNGVVI